jgi:nickel-dependent lactate racemase
MIWYQRGSETGTLTENDLKEALLATFDRLGPARRVLALPPDFTRYHSYAGILTQIADHYYGNRLTDILPAIGTHYPMTGKELEAMFPGIEKSKFRVHNWRKDIITLGEVPGEYLDVISEGRVNYNWPAQVNRLLVNGKFDLILSIGQVVPHEVVGMANYNKNIFIGTGGSEGINKSHFLGAVWGMERMMGRADTPVRRVLNYASAHFTRNLPLLYVLTVVAQNPSGKHLVRGLFIGDDEECFLKACELSLKVNLTLLAKPLKKFVVFLDPNEYRSTWLGNKSIYRTRMALEDGGELIVLAPGLKEFGEDREIDRLIRKYGYPGTSRTLELVKHNEELRSNLSAAAHLIHGSSDGRFSVTYCPGSLSREEIESVNYRYADLSSMTDKINPGTLINGINLLPDGEEIFYISNPALGLWSTRERFEEVP